MERDDLKASKTLKGTDFPINVAQPMGQVKVKMGRSGMVNDNSTKRNQNKLNIAKVNPSDTDMTARNAVPDPWTACRNQPGSERGMKNQRSAENGSAGEGEMKATDDILTAQAAAAFLGAHVETIRRMARKGSIPAFKVGKDWRFRKSSLLAWSETNPGIKRTVGILVVDDDAGVRRLISRYLEPLGYRVSLAGDGAEGLAHIDKGAIDVVLLDLEMPVMDGPTFIRELRQRNQDIPIIVVTGYPDSNLMMAAYAHGPIMLVPKPIEKKVLLTAVGITLEGTRSA